MERLGTAGPGFGGGDVMFCYLLLCEFGEKNLNTATPPLVLSVQAYIPAFYRAICILQAYPLYACRVRENGDKPTGGLPKITKRYQRLPFSVSRPRSS